MILSDLHIHTNFCDGKDSPEDIVKSAIEKKISCIGFSCHSYVPFDEECCIAKEQISTYIETINYLKEKYKDRIKILLGIEQDFYSEPPPSGLYDYVIGSVHYLKINDEYFPLDLSKKSFVDLVNKHFDGDYIKLCEKYFETVILMADKVKPNILGHLDLITKFNKDFCLFDENNERYQTAIKKVIDKIIALSITFEINTGGIARGYKTNTYPNISTIKYIFEKGGKLIFSSDSHSKNTLCFEFEKWNKILKEEKITIK